MKRVISAIAIVAIVSGAFAFKAKPLAGSFCGNPIGVSGCQILPQLREVTGTATHHVKSDWNGTAGDCTNTCPTQIRLQTQN
jgi:hypothetical protein